VYWIANKSGSRKALRWSHFQIIILDSRVWFLPTACRFYSQPLFLKASS
jgi:hypothetical protein